jgi:DNA-binding transcriptional MerR regulator
VNGDTVLRIGELSKRAGVSPELLRAWERRYGLLRPSRSSGGLRLYSLDDLERVRVMRSHLADGLAAAEAAALAAQVDLAREPHAPAVHHAAARADLADALERFDEPRAQAVLDDALAATSLEAVLSDIVLPYLHDLGERWERGDVSVGQEHFASSVLRGRMLGLGRGWGRGLGPLTLLACLPGEQHDLGLIAFGLALRARGWRIAYLGADTPLESVERASDSLAPDLVVLTEERIRPVATELRKLARRHRLALAGAGVGEIDPRELGVLDLPGGPVEEADRVTALVQADRHS